MIEIKRRYCPPDPNHWLQICFEGLGLKQRCSAVQECRYMLLMFWSIWRVSLSFVLMACEAVVSSENLLLVLALTWAFVRGCLLRAGPLHQGMLHMQGNCVASLQGVRPMW